MRTNPIFRPALVSVALLFQTCLMASELVWLGGSGDWNLAGNWSPAQVPTAADNAWITNNGTYTVTVPAGTSANAASLIVGGTSGAQTLAVDRATLTLAGPSTIDSNGQLTLLVSQSVVTGAGSLTVNGAVNWLNGTFSGAGNVTINNSGTLTIGSGGVTLGRTLNNSGSGTWGGGNMTISAGNSFNNQSGATFDITGDGRINGAATTPINNVGLFRLTSGTTGTTITAPVNNTGNLQVLAAILSLNLGGSHSGTFSNAPGATLNFGGGSHSLLGGSFITGPGPLSLSGAATLVANGNFDAGTALSIAAGTAILGSGCNVGGTTLSITASGGIVLYNSASAVGAVNVSAGTLGGSSPIVVTGPLALSGGTVTNALVTAGGGMTINGNTTLNGVKLVNPGIAIWSAGNINGANGAAISNLLGSTFINTFDGNATTGAGATPLFVNAGIFQKTNGTAALGTTSIDFQFLNTGTVEVQTNTLRYNLNQQTAGLTLLDGGGLSVQAQPLQFLGGSLMGTGLVMVANLQNVINASAVSPGLPLGELDISGNYQQTASGALNIELGGYSAGTNFDLITVSAGGGGGTATLAGSLNVSLANNFAPTNGASFTFLTASSRVGSFASFNYPSNEIGMQVSYEPASVTVKVTNLKPIVSNPISDPAPVTYGSTFNFQFPANTFTDPDGDPLTYTASGIPKGITFNAATRTFSGTLAEAGIFPVTVTATDSGTPSLSVTNIFLVTVEPADLTVIAQAQLKMYGALDPSLTFTVGGLQFSDTADSVLTGALARSAGENVAGSPYPITQGTLTANSNYTIIFTSSTFAITPAPLSVTADAKTRVYGAPDPVFTATFAGFVNGDSAAVLDGALGFVRAPGQNVGSYAITPGGVSSANYAVTFTPGTLTITPAPLALTADNKTKTYGAPEPAFTVTYAGFVNGDGPSVLTGTLVFNRVPGENVGNYVISPSGLGSANYTISFNAGTLTITAAALSVTADNKSKTYGAADPALTVSFTGLVNGDTSATLNGTLALNRASGENVGSYSITPGGLSSSNYVIAFDTGTLSITKAGLFVIAESKTKIFGASDPALTFTVSGLQFTDTAADVLTGGLARTAGESVAGSPYPITQGTLTANVNYTINFTGNTLTISPAGLLVTALDANRPYGQTNPVFSAIYAGFVNGQTNTVLGGSLLLTTSADTNSPVGSYAVVATGLTSTDYSITYSNGTLTVLPQALTVKAQDTTKTYGQLDPIFTAAFSGFVNGETSSVLAGALALNRAPGENAGSYVIAPSGLTSSNYAIAFVNGNLTINPAALVIGANHQTKSYGTPDPALTFTVSGLQFADTQDSVLSGSLTRDGGETVAGGPYAIGQGTLRANGNYTVNFTGNSLAITPVPLSITADSKSKIFGSPDPEFTVTYAGLVNGDAPSSLAGVLAITRAPGEDIGNYAITASGLSSPNYVISFSPGTLSILAPGPVILSLTRVGASNIALSWNAISNASYRVQFKEALSSANWTDLPGDVVAGSDTASKTDVFTGMNKYYRVQLLP